MQRVFCQYQSSKISPAGTARIQYSKAPVGSGHCPPQGRNPERIRYFAQLFPANTAAEFFIVRSYIIHKLLTGNHFCGTIKLYHMPETESPERK